MSGVLLECLFASGVAALVSAGACRLVIAAGIKDAPDLARKMHSTPRPTSGGLGVAIGFALGLAVLTLAPVSDWSQPLSGARVGRMASGAAAAFLFLLVGFLDDTHPLGPRGKMTVFVAAALIAPLLVGAPASLPFGDGLSLRLTPAVGVIGAALWVFVLVNAVNFMDGANGLALGSSGIGLLGLAVLALIADAPGPAALALCGVGAVAGFLIWNFPSGRLFAGDAGALFVGALAAVTSLLAIRDGGLSPFTPATLFLPMLADALLTLAWRVGRRPNLLDGHRDHLFQIGLRSGVGHAQITLLYWRAAAGCAVAGVVAAEFASGRWLLAAAQDEFIRTAASYAPFVTFVGLCIVSCVISVRVRRFAAAHGLDQP